MSDEDEITVTWEGKSNHMIPYIGITQNGEPIKMPRGKANRFIAQGKARSRDEEQVDSPTGPPEDTPGRGNE